MTLPLTKLLIATAFVAAASAKTEQIDAALPELLQKKK